MKRGQREKKMKIAGNNKNRRPINLGEFHPARLSYLHDVSCNRTRITARLTKKPLASQFNTFALVSLHWDNSRNDSVLRRQPHIDRLHHIYLSTDSFLLPADVVSSRAPF